MGKPRLLLVIRHAQSEGNQNRQIHQTMPDHRVKLTPEGWTQAHAAGRQLRSMLQKDDTIGFYTSPYRRTRETTEGILRALTSNDPEPAQFKRQEIRVWEEPRLREQDFGNFQPGADAMEKMWRDRADYGHFFYRIPNGESAADAYDRVSGFNESLWRSFSEKDFPSVCVLVTHGLMTRVFLMKWYHWSLEYFEDLRNINHCEFIVMNRSPDTGRFILQNKLRTWSELKRKAVAESGGSGEPRPRKKRGECPDECDHIHDVAATGRKQRHMSYVDVSAAGFVRRPPSPPPIPEEPEPEKEEQQKAPAPVAEEGVQQPNSNSGGVSVLPSTIRACAEEEEEAFPHPSKTQQSKTSNSTGTNLVDTAEFSDNEANLHPQTAASFSKRLAALQRPRQIPDYVQAGRDFGGTTSGAASPDVSGSPNEASDSKDPGKDYFGTRLKVSMSHIPEHHYDDEDEDSPSPGHKSAGKHSRKPEKAERARFEAESGMRSGRRADALGDQAADDGDYEDDEEIEEENTVGEVVAKAGENDDLGGAEAIGRAKAGEILTGREGVGKEQAGREILSGSG